MQEDESFIVAHLFMNPTQRQATSEVKLEKCNNPVAFLSASFRSSGIPSSRNWINVKKIESEDNAWR